MKALAPTFNNLHLSDFIRIDCRNMDDSYESMDTSISPVQRRSADSGQKFGEKYDEGVSPLATQHNTVDVSFAEEEVGDIVIVGDGGSASDQRWDACIGVLENVLMDESFSDAQEEFCRQHCHHFDSTDENKLVYTSIYKGYTDMIESRIQKALTTNVDDLSMEEFYGMLEERQGEICGDIWDMLMTIGDFAEFKNLMLAYKVQEEQMERNTGAMEGGETEIHGNVFHMAPVVQPVGRSQILLI